MVILAKPNETLMEHTENTLKVLKSIKEAYPNVPELCGVGDFWQHLFYALFFHDLGKAAIGFQNSLNNGEYWKYRHEILSASFISSLSEIYSDDTIKAICLGIISHHKNLNEINYYDTIVNVNEEIYLERLGELKTNFEEVIGYLKYVPQFSRKYLGYELETPIKLGWNDLINPFEEDVIFDYQKSIVENNFGVIHGLYGVFLKGFMNVCDYLASSGHYEILNGVEITPLLGFDDFTTTQMMALKSNGSSILIAPTGSGKTEAALLWADNNQNELFSKRVFYILPYTASINAMYERLTRILDNSELVGLSHGKASYYINTTLNDNIGEMGDLTKKIYKPYKVLTPFQIIKYLFSQKGFEMGLSELVNALIIVDEVHAYDSRTTCLLLETTKFLKENLGCEVFIMSATLPKFLKELFMEELSIKNLITFPNAELDKFTRHKVNVIDGHIEDYCDVILNDVVDGKRVLVVCNTVRKSQRIYKWFKKKGIKNSALLHAKFILKHRNDIEKRVDNLDLLVGTQTIEVSLDIDYDVLYTEPAPFDALIQRAGRVNRRGWSKKIIKSVNVFTYGSKEDNYIYNQGIVEKTLNHLKKVDVLKESKIQEIIDDVYNEGYSEMDQEIFDEVKKAFENIIDNLFPFINSSKKEYNGLFNSITVVHDMYRDKYLGKMDNKEYFEAMGYCLDISESQFYNQKTKGNIVDVKDTYFIDVFYDSELGLLL